MRALVSMAIMAAAFTAACDRSQDKPASPPPPTEKPRDAEPTDGKDAPSDAPKAPEAVPARAGHSGEVIELGTTKVGEYAVRAARDKGEIKPGGDAPVDAWVDGGLGQGVTAVRFWIGDEDAKGSVKAKAAVEDGKWHAHVEIPDPLPPANALWIELETAAGTIRGSVPL